MSYLSWPLVAKLIAIAVPITVIAGVGLWLLIRSVHQDEVALAGSASAIHRSSVEAAAQQASCLVEQARRSAALVSSVRELQLHFQQQVLAFNLKGAGGWRLEAGSFAAQGDAETASFTQLVTGASVVTPFPFGPPASSLQPRIGSTIAWRPCPPPWARSGWTGPPSPPAGATQPSASAPI
jgi:hypothetical protein